MQTALVLSGGGLKGVAHLGVWQVLKENNIQIDGVVGTSAGSIAAAAIALGLNPEELLTEIKKLKPRDLYDLPWWVFLLWELLQILPQRQFKANALVTLPKGLLTGKKLMNWLTTVFSNIDMGKIDFPLAITATDINSAKSFVFISKGLEPAIPDHYAPESAGKTIYIANEKLVQAMRASTSIPGVFAPIQRGSSLLVDGGVTNNLPADIMAACGFKKILAVDLGQQDNLKKPVSNIVDISVKAIEILIQSTSQVTSKAYCDLTLTPQTGSIALWDLAAIDRAFEAGQKAAIAALPEIINTFS
ncbi:MAG: patatin-like phospholipase family protein [Bacillota bacterium]|nr:patatin-like phospholipase family protein [Bacillota bacterium]